MSYMHIDNLYKNKDILFFKECYAMEKIHGTSAHLQFNFDELSGKINLKYFAGGENHENFVKLFNHDELLKVFVLHNFKNITIYGEAYGGKQQGMKDTYGDKLKFIAFEVKIGENWISVPQAEQFCKDFGIEFVYYEIVPTDIEILDKLTISPSIQAVRNGCGDNKLREGIVLRPLIELTKNNGERIISKHKNEKFKEREHQPKLTEGKSLEVLTEINLIVDEWVTEMRLSHVLDKFPNATVEQTKDVISVMIEDVLREGKGEILISENNKDLMKAIGKRTASLFIKRLK